MKGCIIILNQGKASLALFRFLTGKGERDITRFVQINILVVEDGSLTPGFKLSGLINSLCAWSTVVEVLDDGHYKTNMCK